MNTLTKHTQKAALFAALVLCIPAHAMTGKAGQMVAKPASSLLATQAGQCAARFFSSPAAQNVCRMTAVGAFAQARNLSRAQQGQKQSLLSTIGSKIHRYATETALEKFERENPNQDYSDYKKQEAYRSSVSPLRNALRRQESFSQMSFEQFKRENPIFKKEFEDFQKQRQSIFYSINSEIRKFLNLDARSQEYERQLFQEFEERNLENFKEENPEFKKVFDAFKREKIHLFLSRESLNILQSPDATKFFKEMDEIKKKKQ